ncbi:LysR family transcriptional regulator [Thalassospira lucentensis]|mgnify:FL=1|uniref:LysR family transcriptional regulator n=1 Tax=Thalassospira lucentensis TaxID=168935 RepID=UPI003D2A88AE|tara:strand:+ start:132634 stop:133560 length:927 start_codon:yes stop_codon:yes gene_type:complete
MKDYLSEMRSFAAVIEQGSFTDAARATGVSKGLISQHVKRLEDVLGAQLLFRSTRKLELTEIGGTFLAYCQNITQSADAAFEAVEALRGEPVGSVRITVPVSFGEMFLQDIIVAFQKIHPRIQIEMELENTFRDLQASHIDIAIRAGLTDDPDQVAIPLGQLSELVCASPAYWQHHTKPQTPHDLSDHNCLVNFQYYKDRKWVFFSQSGPQSITAQGNLRLNHYPLIRNATVQGLGVARLPRYVAMPEIHAGRLETALEEYRSPLRPIYLVYAYQGNLPVKNRLMIDFIRNWFTERPDLLETNGPNSV